MLSLCVTLAGALPAAGQLSFTDVTAETGMWSVPTAWGVTCVDIDSDGDIDLLMANNGSENAVFLNEGGLRFRGQPLIGGAPGTEALVPADIGGDGNLDLLACVWGGPLALFQGDGRGWFTEVTEEAGLRAFAAKNVGGAAFGDIDADGDPDLYIPDGTEGDRLCLNGGGVFTDVGEVVGLPHVPQSESAIMGDFDDDGRLDIYVPRYDQSSSLYLNREEGGFTDLSASTDVFKAPQQVAACPFDADGDGDLDLLLVRGRFTGEGQTNALLVNLGKGEFVDMTPAPWLEQPLHNHTACAGDVDHDGDADVFFSTREGCSLWLNDGNGQFRQAPGDGLWAEIAGAGAILCDLDDDGDLDILVRERSDSQPQAPSERLFRNDLNDGKWLKVRPIEATGSRFCPGAQVWIYDPGGLGDRERLVARGDTTSACGWSSYGPFVVHFGLDAAKTYDVEVRFPDGPRGTQTGVKPGQSIEVKAE